MPVLQAKKMSQNGHEERSCTKRSSTPDATGGARPARPVRASKRRPLRRPQQPPLPLVLYLFAPPSRTLPHLPVRPVRPASQRNGNRQYLRARREATLLRRRMGAEHPLLPRTPSNRPGRVAKTCLVRIVRPKRISVFHATPCGAFTGGRRTPRVTHGGRPSRGVHGSHQDLPRASGEAESAPCRLSGVFLSEGHRPLHDRRVRLIRRTTHRKPTGEVPMRPRGVLPESVPQPAHEVRQAAAETALLTNSQLSSHRTALLCAISWENSHRDPHKGHAALRELVLVALYGDHVTYDVEAAGSGMIHALRLPAVPAEPAVRPFPKVPARSPA